MARATAEILYRIAGRKAREGDAWDALAAHLAADTLAITAQVEDHPAAMLDAGALRGLDLTGADLPAAVAGFRRRLLTGLDSWGLADTVGAALPPVNLPGAALDPGTAGDFAAGQLAGRALADFAPAQQVKAGRLAALSVRLHDAGEHQASIRAGLAADAASFAAHHGVEAAAVGDTFLAALRTGMLLAGDALAAEEPVTGDPAAAMEQSRRIHDAANLTGKPVHWEPLSYLS